MKHIVMWQLNDGINKEEVKKKIKNALEGLNGRIKGLIKLEVHVNTIDSSTHDLMLESYHESIEDLKSYAFHPLHVEAGKIVKENTHNRLCIDILI